MVSATDQAVNGRPWIAPAIRVPKMSARHSGKVEKSPPAGAGPAPRY